MLSSNSMPKRNNKTNWQYALDQFDIPNEFGKRSIENRFSPILKQNNITTPSNGLRWLPHLTLLAGCIIAIGNIPLQSPLNTSSASVQASNSLILSSKQVEKNKDKISNEITPSLPTSDIATKIMVSATITKPILIPSTPAITIKKVNSLTINKPSLIPITTRKNTVSLSDNKQILKEGETLTLVKRLTLPKNSLATFSTTSPNKSTNYNNKDWSTHIVKANQNLKYIVKKLNIKASLSDLNSNKAIKTKLSSLQTGDIIRVKSTNNQLATLIVQSPTKRKSFIAQRYDNTFKTSHAYKVVERRQSRKIIDITNSWRYNANKIGLSERLINQINQIFDRDVKLYNDLRKGDRVTLIYDVVYHNGEKVSEGDIIAAELVHDNRTHRALRYTFSDGRINYYTPKGMDLNKSFRRHPLAKPRITSSFSYRRLHPILNRYRPHTGTDYGAPRGTPIYATGNGIVKFAGSKGGYGKTIILKHGSGYTTSYSHMQGYAKNIHSGRKVFLGDVIGYVGNTGRSTGPHLHYEFRIHGKPQNAVTVQLPKTLSLRMADLKQFKGNSQSLVLQLNVLHRFAEAEVDISNGFGG